MPAAVAAGIGARSSHGPANPDPDRTPVRRLEFVEVRAGPTLSRRRAARAATATTPRSIIGGDSGATDVAEGPLPVGPAEPGWSLWGDAEP